jgi:hypothetical protein
MTKLELKYSDPKFILQREKNQNQNCGARNGFFFQRVTSLSRAMIDIFCVCLVPSQNSSKHLVFSEQSMEQSNIWRNKSRAFLRINQFHVCMACTLS